jgi:hypothetical protein
MESFREIRNCLTWHNEGKFDVELINGVITKLNFCEPGVGPEDPGRSLTSTSYKFLQSVHSCLGELFAFIDEENKRLGYKYAREIEAKGAQEELAENSFAMPAETKLRSLINYSHQPELMKSSMMEEKELIRDIG